MNTSTRRQHRTTRGVRRHVVAALVIVAAATAASLQSAAAADTSTARRDNKSDDRFPQGNEPVNLKAKDFTINIDNRYWPMTPGTRWTYREIDADGTEALVELIVTNKTKKMANGIVTREIRDTVRVNGAVIEDTKDWYAQDDDGNIWYFGEETAEFDNGQVVSTAGSFEAYVKGALPGILLPGSPKPGQKYRQEYFKGEAEDNGEVLSTHELVEVPFGKYRDALLTRDTITIKPDVQQYKLYAAGVGPAASFNVSGGPFARSELISVDTVGPTVGTGPLGNP